MGAAGHHADLGAVHPALPDGIRRAACQTAMPSVAGRCSPYAPPSGCRSRDGTSCLRLRCWAPRSWRTFSTNNAYGEPMLTPWQAGTRGCFSMGVFAWMLVEQVRRLRLAAPSRCAIWVRVRAAEQAAP